MRNLSSISIIKNFKLGKLKKERNEGTHIPGQTVYRNKFSFILNFQDFKVDNAPPHLTVSHWQSQYFYFYKKNVGVTKFLILF